MTEQDEQKTLAKICHLFCLNEYVLARMDIQDAAQVHGNFSTPEEMDKYILAHTNDPQIQKMVALDRAFTHLGYWYNHPGQLSESIMNENLRRFKEFLPIMEQDDALRVKYWQSEMYIYPRLEDDTPRYQLLDDLIQSYPDNYKDTDFMMQRCAEHVSRLRIPAADAYKTIKTAQKKTSYENKYSYKQMLAPVAEKYFDLVLSEADDLHRDYQTRLVSYQKVYDVIDDISIKDDERQLMASMPGKVKTMEDTKKHRRRLLILSRINKLHKENGNLEAANAIKKKKTDLCVAYYDKYPQFKKKTVLSFDKI